MKRGYGHRMSDATLLEVARGVATITLNRPDNKNALSTDLVDSFGDHLEAAVADHQVRCIVVTNTGNTFCAGADLKSTQPGVAPPQAKRDFVQIMEAIMDSPKPVIGKVNGHCTGGGVGFAAVMDISVAREDALIGFTEARIGVAPAVISVVCLKKLRHADAQLLMLTGERLPASRWAELGLVNQAVPEDQLDAAVDEIVSKVVLCGPNALAACKQLIARVPDMDRDPAFAWTKELSESLFVSDEAKEGIAAFRERRPAAWVPQ